MHPLHLRPRNTTWLPIKDHWRLIAARAQVTRELGRSLSNVRMLKDYLDLLRVDFEMPIDFVYAFGYGRVVFARDGSFEVYEKR